MNAELFAATILLVLVIDPFGNVPIVVAALAYRRQRWLGARAMLAFERLMGLVLTALAVEMLLSGVRSFVGALGK